MKTKTFYQLSIKVVALLLVFITLSCSDNVEDLEIDALTAYTLPESLKSGISHVDGMVAFESQEQFEEISQALMAESDRYLLDYISGLGIDLTDDEVNDIMYENNFNHYLVFETFENYHGITSLRSVLQAREDAWLNSEELIGDNPGEYPISVETLPFTNVDGEYMIGSTIMHIEKSGVAYKILNKDFEALSKVRAGTFKLNENMSSEVRLASNVIVSNPKRAFDLEESARTQAGCRPYAYASGTYKNHSGSNYKMYWDLSARHMGLNVVAQSKLLVKRKTLGRWIPYITYLYIQFKAKRYDNYCNALGTQTVTKSSGSALYIIASVRYKDDFQVKADGSFYGYFDSGKHNKIKRTYGVD